MGLVPAKRKVFILGRWNRNFVSCIQEYPSFQCHRLQGRSFHQTEDINVETPAPNRVGYCILNAVFRIRTFFFRIRIELFFWIRPKIWIRIRKIRIWSGKSGSGYMTKTSKNWRTTKFFFSTLNTVLFGQVHPKPNQKRHLDPISLLIYGSRSGFLKSRSGSAKNPGSIRIRNTVGYQ